MKKLIRGIGLTVSTLAVSAVALSAQTLPKVSLQVGQSSKSGDLSATLQIIILLTVLALAPSILIMVTSFIRIVVVLSFLRHAMGIHQMPPNQLLVSLALILTFFLMSPIVNQSYSEGIKPYLNNEIS
ncbi:MAG: flagellar biosynthetic protein FliP, partial [candidate division Zixibacteria bacterium]|nr:flagellar biosynthetic protein FliP [candidate division Zixibacteria bacterium]